MMLELSVIIDAIVGICVGKAVKEVGRRDTVLKLMKRFKLNPSDPPTDFDGIYAYALIEYGVSNPQKTVLNFLRSESVQRAFRQSFPGDPTILDKEAEGIIKWNEEKDKLGPIDYDPRREFAAFSAIFNEIVDRTRTPSEVKHDWKIEKIHSDIRRTGKIVEHLAVELGTSRKRQDTPLDHLAQQTQTWFETLGYRFEGHDTQDEGYFEWIINVPTRRRYDRILVRGITGEAKTNHVNSLRLAVDKHKTDEGWLVTARRKSQAACDKAEENRHIFCYTLDELLDESADFGIYFDWLEAEVKRRGIDRMYVTLACTQDEFDPVAEEKIGESLYAAHDGGIDSYIDRWLDDPAKEHISILGEFGTGKTWFALHYAWITLQRYRQAKERGTERPRLPLVIPLRDYAKAVSVESLFSEFFFRKHEIPLPGYSAFEQLNRMGKLLLIFDGFDEMAARVDRQKMINNFWELARVVVPGAKVILTCRTEHFPEAKESRALLSAELQASTAKLTGEAPQFEVLELEKFDDDQIRRVLSYQIKPDTIEQVMGNSQLLDLARRPIMIEYILDAKPDIEAGKPVDLSRIYLYAVRSKMERDIKNERTFTSLADKLYFLCELSWEMLSTDQMSLNYRQFPDRIRQLFGPVVQKQKDLDHWHFDMLSQAMLIRNADGDYTPAHRSLIEFFAAYKLVAELGVMTLDFAEVAQAQSHVDKEAPPQDYTWSEYFQREIDECGEVKRIAPLRSFVTENIGPIHEQRYEQLSRNILIFAANMIVNDPVCIDKLCKIALDRTGKLAWNAICLLPFLEYPHPETMANALVDKSKGVPLKSRVAWVLGELGVANEKATSALNMTVNRFGQSYGTSTSGWDAAFALEKLGKLGSRKGRQGDIVIDFLVKNLPPNYTYNDAIKNLRRALAAKTYSKARINPCDIVMLVKHESRFKSSQLFRQMLEMIDFSADMKGRRCYFMTWLCGHLQIEESVPYIIEACEHPANSVRNCACEALGKIGVESSKVIKALEQGLTDRYYRTRFHAAWSLGELESTASIPKLSAAIKVEEVIDVREEMTRVRDFLSKLATVGVDAKTAQRKATNWLVSEVGNLLLGDKPSLTTNGRSVWRVPVLLTSPERGIVGQVGVVNVDAQTGEVLVNSQLIQELIESAHQLARSAPPPAE